MRDITVTLYKFDELSEAAKDKAIENLYDINVDYEWWYDEGLIDLSSKEVNARHLQKEYLGIKDMLFTWKEIYFDIDRGAYLQFEGLKVNHDDIFRKWLRIPKRLWQNCQYSFDSHSEQNTRLVIEADKENGEDFTAKEQAIIDRAIEIFSDKIQEGLSSLRKQYEYLTSREGIIETIEANDYEFTENGKLA